MKEHKISLIVLIDDNPVTIFFNRMAIEKSRIAKKVVSFKLAAEALDYMNPDKTVHTIPDFIFLDLHMPAMNGWDFLEKYNKLNPDFQSSVIILHDNSLLPKEQEKLNEYAFVRSLHKKALTKEMVVEICQRDTGFKDSLSLSS